MRINETVGRLATAPNVVQISLALSFVAVVAVLGIVLFPAHFLWMLPYLGWKAIPLALGAFALCWLAVFEEQRSALQLLQVLLVGMAVWGAFEAY